jgi:foldase protein PrsA
MCDEVKFSPSASRHFAKLGLFRCLSISLIVLLFAPATNAFSDAADVERGIVLDMVLASVDGEPLTVSDLRRYASSRGGELPDDIHDGSFEVRKVLRELVLQNLLQREAQAAGIAVSEEEVNAYVAEIMSQNKVDTEEFKKLLANRGIGYQQYIEQVRDDIVRARVVSTQIRARVNILDEDVERYLQKYPGTMPKPGMVWLHEIFVPIAGGQEAAMSRISAMREALLSGKTWEATGRDYYKSVGYVVITELREEFQAAVEDLEVDQVSDVVSSSRGYHLFRISSRVPEEGISIEDSADDSEEEKKSKSLVESIDPTLRDRIRDDVFKERYQAELDTFLNDELPKKYHVELKL